MKKVTITIIILLLVALWTSCSNNLDEKVYSEILDETYQYQTDDLRQTLLVRIIRCALTIRCTIGMWKNNLAAVS